MYLHSVMKIRTCIADSSRYSILHVYTNILLYYNAADEKYIHLHIRKIADDELYFCLHQTYWDGV